LLDPTQEKSSGVLFRFSWLNLIHEYHGGLSYSLLFLEDFSKKIAEEKSVQPECFYLEKTPETLAFFDYLEKQIFALKDPRYFLKFDKFFSDFETKFGASRISPEFQVIISERRKKYVEKAQEIKEKLPQMIEQAQEILKEKILKRNEKMKEKMQERQMKVEALLDEQEQKKKAKKDEKQNRKAKTPEEMAPHPEDYTWVEVRKRRKNMKEIVDPASGQKKTVIKSNRGKENPNHRGIYHKR